MAAKPKLTPEQFAEMIERADDLAFMLADVEGRWPFGLDASPFPNIEQAAQTLNRLIESAASAQRLVLSSIALKADERRIRAELAERA